MSWEATAWAVKRKTGSPSSKVVLLCMANYASKSGVCWPAQESIAKQTEQSVDTVQRRINELETAGFLSRVERDQQNGKKGGRYVYRLNMAGDTPTIEDVDDEEESTPQSAARSSGRTTPQIEADHTANDQKPHRNGAVLKNNKQPSFLEPTSASGLAPVDDWPVDFFEQFWKKYPPGRKTSKKEAKLKLEKIRKKGDHEGHPVTFAQIMTGLDSYIASRPDPQFTKAPEVWLNKECWAGEAPPTPRPGKGPGGGLTLFQIASGDFSGDQT